MKWIRERDALIAQTMAFVQSVTGRTDVHPPEGETSALTVDITTIETTVVREVAEVPATAKEPFRLPVPPARPASDFRHEMQARIASFRKHQERFEREREEYCAATLTRLRAAIRDGGAQAPARKAPPAV
jgi:hypothetical protein